MRSNSTRIVLVATFFLSAGVGCTSGSGGSLGSGGTSGGDVCTALRDKQAAAGCPKFDPAKYLSECQQTVAQIPASCKSQFDALANCFLSQNVTCTDAGKVNDDTPPACKSQDDALSSCGGAK